MAEPDPKTTGKTTSRIPQPHGGALNSGGTPGNAGGGRPKNAFKNFLSDLRADPAGLAAFETVARDPKLKNWGAAWKLMADYDDDKPAEKHAIVGPVEVRVKIVREGRRAGS